MRVDISEVIMTAGARLYIDKAGIVEGLTDIYGLISVEGTVDFKGVLTNLDGLLHLEGKASCTYSTCCDSCSKPISRKLQINISEDLVQERQDREEDELYIYSGNWLNLDKILADSITLAVPMSHRCNDDCEIVCPKCGEPITAEGCSCAVEPKIDPRLAALKDLFDKEHSEKAD